MRLIGLLALLALTGCSATHHERTQAMTTDHRTMTIELLALDLETCGRCTGSSANLDAAIAVAADVLREADVTVEVRKTVVTTAEQAERLRFESSPTIRVNGRDIALELRESNCGDCGDLCGCDGQVECRVWVWRGQEHTEAPKAMIVDAILREYSRAWEPASVEHEPFNVPENLLRFFDATSSASPEASHNKDGECCDRTTCCEPSEKEACCGSGAARQPCGCAA